MKWVGLTGGIASGKSSVSKVLREMSYPVIDADVLAHEVLKLGTEGLRQVTSAFGPEILKKNGELDRKKMGEIVFSDQEKRLQLEALIHPLVRDLQMKKRNELEQKNTEIAFYDVPLLFEKNLESQFYKVIVVYSSNNTQLERLKLRDGISDEEALARLNSQMDIEEKKKRGKGPKPLPLCCCLNLSLCCLGLGCCSLGCSCCRKLHLSSS